MALESVFCCCCSHIWGCAVCLRYGVIEEGDIFLSAAESIFSEEFPGTPGDENIVFS